MIPALVASVLVASGVTFAGAASAAGAAGSRPADAVADAQRKADAASNKYFKELSSYHSLDSSIASIEDQLTVAQARRDKLRHQARLRAAEVYRNAGTALGNLDAGTALDAARRNAMFDSVSANDLTVFSQLRRASDDLQARREQLKAQKQNQASRLDDLKAQERKLETTLRAAVTQRQADSGPPTSTGCAGSREGPGGGRTNQAGGHATRPPCCAGSAGRTTQAIGARCVAAAAADGATGVVHTDARHELAPQRPVPRVHAHA